MARLDEPVPNVVPAKKATKLIPIKGVDEPRAKLLGAIGIMTPADLLMRGQSKASRAEIARYIMLAEKTDYSRMTSREKSKWDKRYSKYVDSWVKQADLWRVSDMDENTAYFLVELGVRFVEDLARVDVAKAYPMMQSLSYTQVDYSLITRNKLATLIENSKKVAVRFKDYQSDLTQNINTYIAERAQNILTYFKKERFSTREIDLVQREFRNILSGASEIRLDKVIGGGIFQFDEPAPTFLFVDENKKEEEVIDVLDNIKIIQEGLGYLNDVEQLLPLPSVLQGSIFMVRSGEIIPQNPLQRLSYALTDALVELEGISSPSEDKAEKQSGPHTYTDAYGNFKIKLPEKYSMEEIVTLVVSRDGHKQKFSLVASDVLNHVAEQKILAAFNELDVVMYDKQADQIEIKKLEDQQAKKGGLTEEQAKDLRRLYDEKNLLEEREKKLTEYIKLSDSSTTDMKRILRNLTSRSDLVADYSSEPFVLTEELFKRYRVDQKKVLPSVKLMEDDQEQPIYLPTDTAPSRIFSYSMLQRLVEPKVYPLADAKNGKARITLNQGVDITDFKEKLTNSPEKITQMSSLGIGYNLKMHQAWVPDGFALGNLLYSLVLAPGEEQRLIVREKKQSYEIKDTAEGTDYTDEEYESGQKDNTTAAYDYALNQMMQGDSHYDYSTSSTSVGFSAGYSGFGASLGLSVGHSSSKGNANSSASQSNSHNEASRAAQDFQNSIKSASNKISSAQRISMSLATSDEQDSVATRIIANHNHSHTMTIQYWEVMRRYRLETCVDGVDLVLFVPVQLINFLNGKNYFLDLTKDMDITTFQDRYKMLLSHADVLMTALPYSYRNGIRLVKKYYSMPNWEMAKTADESTTVTYTFYGNFLPTDTIEATLLLKNGKGSIAGEVTLDYDDTIIKEKFFQTSESLKQAIKQYRRRPYTANEFKGVRNNKWVEELPTPKCTCTFTVPKDITNDELSRIRLNYFTDDIHYELYKSPGALAANGEKAADIADHMWGKAWDLAKDKKDSDNDRTKIAFDQSILPEAWIAPNVVLSSQSVKRLGVPKIYHDSFSVDNDTNISGVVSSYSLSAPVYIDINGATPTLKLKELEEIESLMHHVASNTMKYSQAVWAALSSDERAMMLEKYTIDMDYADISGDNKDEVIDIPLLNCINVKKMLGFYGNCMLFPFTYPEKLAVEIGKTAAELQDSLYRYHTNYFRVPTTTISLPTDGMIGESVLGETNVSEKIDLTRFWNWQDSPIDSMTLDSSYLSGADLLANKTTKDINALNIQGATQTTPITAADLVSALVAKNTPTFDNITGSDNLANVLNNATNTTAAGRDTALKTSAEMAKAALEYASKSQENQGASGKSNPVESNPGGSNPGESNPGGSNPGGSNPGGSNPGGSNPGGSNPGGSNPGGSNPGGSNPGESNPRGSNPGGSNPDGENNPGGTNPDENMNETDEELGYTYVYEDSELEFSDENDSGSDPIVDLEPNLTEALNHNRNGEKYTAANGDSNLQDAISSVATSFIEWLKNHLGE